MSTSNADTELRKGRFTLDIIRTTASTEQITMPGWADGDLWDGWQSPLFERDAAELLAASLDQLGLRLTYDRDRDAYIALPEDHDPAEGEPDPDDVDYYYGYDATGPEVRTLHLYPIGTRVWCWEPA